MKRIDGFWFPDDDKHFTKQVPLADYQRPQYDAALSYCKHRRVAIDVGAHVGIFTRRMADDFRYVVAIEPTPSAFECLQVNTEVFDSVDRLNIAAGAKYGKRQMHDLPCGWAFFADDPEIAIEPYKPVPRIDVVVQPLDGFFDKYNDIDLVKIDVQGAEAAVLRGAENMLSMSHPVVLIEEKPLGKTDFTGIHAAQAVLNSLGYRCVKRVGADAIYVHS